MTGKKDEKSLIPFFGGSMHCAPILSGWDTAVFILPFLGLLGLWMFGLDELLAAPGTRAAQRRPFCDPGTGNDSFMTDPDGTPWPRRHSHNRGKSSHEAEPAARRAAPGLP